MRALVAPLMDGEIEAGAFFRVAGGRGAGGLLGLLLWAPRQLARERQAGMAAFNYVAVRGPDVGIFELRWAPLRMHRTVGHWPVESLAAERTATYEIVVRLDDRKVELEAAAPGIDASEVIERLTSY